MPHDILLLREKDAQGEDVYFFVRVYPGKKVVLAMMPKGTDYNIEAYGDILASGYGEPDEAVLRYINESCNVQFGDPPGSMPNLQETQAVQDFIHIDVKRHG